MKQLVFSVLTVLALSPAAQATSLRDVRLMYQEVPTHAGLPLNRLKSNAVRLGS